ncbi:MAG TPA: NfeD family protein [Vicinamibacteria bacterium]|nr:NfeD family protein [Vicinamibacteria bacterium]
MAWWLWVLIGLFLLALEAATPGGLFFLFFGLSGLAVGTLVALDWGGSLAIQWILFTAIATVALIVLRGPLKARLNVDGLHKPVDQLSEQVAVALEDLPVGGIGKVEHRGSPWSARNGGLTAIAKGQRCRVERVDGLTLWVRIE